MAGSRIKGITVEIGGDTTKLQSALKGVNSEIKNTQSQLKDVEKLLKLDPGNIELLAQKQKLLSSAVSETKEKLATLKTAAEHEDFEAAAALTKQRASEKGIKKGNAKYQQRYAFSSKIICGECGEMFRRIHWNNRGCKSIVWRCISRLEPTGQECHARTVNEAVLENVVVQAINTLFGDTSTYQAQLQQNIAKVIRSAQQNTADGINERLQRLQKELLKKANNKEADDEIFKLREQREKCTVDTAARDAQIARINELQDFIKQQPSHLKAFDDALVKRWLERIIVWDDHFTVELKSGLKIEIEG